MPGNLWIEENWVDATRGCRIGDSGVYETHYETSERGQLYRALVKEYGRCVSRVYIDKADGGVQAVGWVFQQRKKYDDTHETFLRETWVTLHSAPPTHTVTPHYVAKDN